MEYGVFSKQNILYFRNVFPSYSIYTKSTKYTLLTDDISQLMTLKKSKNTEIYVLIMYAHDWYSGNFSDFELGCFVIMLQLYNINHKDSKEMLNIILQTLI